MSKNSYHRALLQFILLGGLLLLVMGLARLVFAHGNVDQSAEAYDTPFSLAVSGQTFTPTVNNLVAVDLNLDIPSAVNVTVSIYEGNPNGPRLGSVTRQVVEDGWSHFDFEPPIPLTPGQSYAIRGTSNNFLTDWRERKGAGPNYPFGVAWICDGIGCIERDDDADKSFRTYFEVPDADGDGVPDTGDLCPATDIPESVPTITLKPNHWALVDGDIAFDTVVKGKGDGPARSYTTADTAGCSCEQIIAELGLGEGYIRYGCSTSVMDEWVESVNP